ncbi:Ubiquinone biosynthesis O-methyltransferase [Blattella germanica]|nr:Ubiquinone biosynthesis O-methyltransferase [Blattella germanica]
MGHVIFPRLLQSRCQVSSFICGLKTTSVKHDQRKNDNFTVHKEDIEFYNRRAHQWWDERGEMKGLHALNKLRVQFIRDGLINTRKIDRTNRDGSQPLKGLKILEIGCGGGILSEPLARIGATVTGIDASKNMIETAQLHASQDPSISDRVTYIFGTIEENVKDCISSYDAVVASEVLEHVSQKDLFLESCVSTLKPGGSVFITTLNRTFSMWAGGILFAEYLLRLVPQGTHDINKYGCSVGLMHGMMYNFLANEWFWTSNTSMNYALHAVKKEKT